MENLWKTYGKPMENLWKNYGKAIEKLWKSYGKVMENYYPLISEVGSPKNCSSHGENLGV